MPLREIKEHSIVLDVAVAVLIIAQHFKKRQRRRARSRRQSAVAGREPRAKQEKCGSECVFTLRTYGSQACEDLIENTTSYSVQ